MNSLLGSFGRTRLPLPREVSDGWESFAKNGCLLRGRRIHVFDHDARLIHYDARAKILCAIVGYVSNLEEARSRHSLHGGCDVEIVRALYRQGRVERVCELDGVFTIFIFDENRQKAYVLQDDQGAGLPVYYVRSDHALVFGTSLKRVIKYAGIRRELNLRAARALISTGVVIPGEETLVEGIRKLLPQQYLTIDTASFAVEARRRPVDSRRVSLPYAARDLLPSISDSVERISEGLKSRNRVLTLSSGYDSNLILHTLRDFRGLTAVTIGGRQVNEIGNAQRIVKHYCQTNRGIRHVAKTIGPDLLDAVPDIVWRLEGYVSEIGVFLQYELAKALRTVGTESVILDEAADQVLSSRSPNALNHRVSLSEKMRRGVRSLWRRQARGRRKGLIDVIRRLGFAALVSSVRKEYREYRSAPAYYASSFDYVLKKNQLMLNSFGIQGLYPFLNRRTRSAADALRMLNFNKAYYRMRVSRLLDPEVSRLLAKNDGSTDVAYLFEDRAAELFAGILNAPLMKRLLGQATAARILKGRPYFFSNRRAANFMLALLSIHVFNELFISGRFDSELEEEGVAVSLGDCCPAARGTAGTPSRRIDAGGPALPRGPAGVGNRLTGDRSPSGRSGH